MYQEPTKMMLDLAMGNDGSSYVWICDNSSTTQTSYRYQKQSSSPRHGSNSFCRSSTYRSPMVSTIYIIALFSWISATYLTGHTKEQITLFQSTQWTLDQQYRSHLSSIKDFNIKLRTVKSAVDALKNTRQALEHEVKVIRELDEGSEPVKPSPSNRALVDKWLHERQDGLKLRMEYLQTYLQSFSKQQVLQRWGEGPHQVAFTIEYKNDKGESNNRQVVVELASVHDMPHSVHFFLEMAELRIWDNTVLLHHENIEHLIAAVPVDFRHQQFKHSHLAYLGWTKLGFPEYHSKYQHDKYTLGFANSGPSWYLNTVDNAMSHGPGGQSAKKLLEHDADPCFARVVQGHDVVDELIEFGLHQRQVEFDQGHPWADEPHTWTHLVKVEIVQA